MNGSGDSVDWPPLQPLPAIILSGGRSRRMGTDKTRLPLEGGTVYSRVEEIFAPLASHLIVVIGHDGQPPESQRQPLIARDEHPDLGPLEGLRVALQKCADLAAPLAMVTTVDAPLVVPDVYRFMVRSLLDEPAAQIAAPYIDDIWHPLTAVWRTAILDEVQQRIDRRQLRVKDLLDSVPVVKLTRSDIQRFDPGLQSIRNINTREQYRQLQQELRRRT